MNESSNVDQILPEVRDSLRALVDELRKRREAAERLHLKQNRDKRLALWLLVGFAVLVVLAAILISVFGQPGRQAQQQQNTLDRNERYLDRIEKDAARAEALQERRERQADRFDALLKKWEKAEPKE
jgi:hypothetical protein